MVRACTEQEYQELAERLATVLESMSRPEATAFKLSLDHLVEEKRADIRRDAQNSPWLKRMKR